MLRTSHKYRPLEKDWCGTGPTRGAIAIPGGPVTDLAAAVAVGKCPCGEYEKRSRGGPPTIPLDRLWRVHRNQGPDSIEKSWSKSWWNSLWKNFMKYVHGFQIVMAFPGLVNYVPAVAYHFCLNLLVAFSQPGNGLIVKPCSLYRSPLQIDVLPGFFARIFVRIFF